MIDDPLLAATAVAFVLAIALQGRSFFALRFAPTRSTAAAIAAALLPAGLSGLLLLLGRGSLAYPLVLWLGIFGLCGFTIPWVWVLLVERHGLAGLGIGARRWKASLLLSLGFAAATLLPVLRADVSRYEPAHVLGAAVQLNVGGLFELFLYYGLLHLRLRDAFGPLPAIVGSAGLYSLWHIGTELPLHSDPVAALGMLFVVGLLCHALFASTYELLVIWPFFYTAGVMNDFLLNLDLPDVIGREPSWTALGWGLALLVPTSIAVTARARERGVGRGGLRYVSQRLVLLALFAGVLFVAAGGTDWPRAWAALGAILVCEAATLGLLAIRAPATLNQRGVPGTGVAAFDKTFAVLWLLLSFVTATVAGLERRLTGADVPGWGLAVGLALLVPATAFACWAMLENEHFEQLVRIQHDRGHRVVTTGPYRLVRHPGYLAAIVGALATPLLLGTPWSFAPACFVAALFAVRTSLEDRTLKHELTGYAEYAARTRFRLLPGVW